jgi:O-antigen ligase
MTPTLVLPIGPANIAILALLALLFVSISGVLPLGPAALAVPGVAVGALALALPRLALALLIVSIPFSSWTKVTLGTFDVTATDVLVGALALGWLLPGLISRSISLAKAPAVGAGLVLLCAMLLSSLTADDFPSAVKELIKLGEVLMVALYVASTMRTGRDLRFILLISLAAAVAESFVGLYQFATGSGPETFQIGPFIRAFGDFSQPNAFAGYLAVIFPLGIALSLVGERERWFARAATAVLAIAITVSLSRGAWVGLGLALALMALIWGRATRLALAIAGGALGLALVFGVAGVLPETITDRVAVVFENFLVFDVRNVEPNPQNFALVERLAHWYAAWGMFEANPIVGVGPGNYDAAYETFQLQGWSESLGHAHNYYLNTLAELGIIGFTAFMAFMVAIFVRAGQAIRRAPGSEPIYRAVAIGALGAAVTLSAHNAFDNMLVHGIGVQFGIAIGLVEMIASTRAERATPPAAPQEDLRVLTNAHRN